MGDIQREGYRTGNGRNIGVSFFFLKKSASYGKAENIFIFSSFELDVFIFAAS